MNNAYLLTGSNLGDRLANLNTAKALIDLHCGKTTRFSSVYETAAWGKIDQPSFLNQALEIETTLHPKELIKKVLKVEKLLGRKRTEKYGPRIIDVDIIFFNNEIIKKHFLAIPHPEVQNRRFALVPLSELAPDLIHPVLKKSIRELLEACSDKLEVKKYE